MGRCRYLAHGWCFFLRNFVRVLSLSSRTDSVLIVVFVPPLFQTCQRIIIISLCLHLNSYSHNMVVSIIIILSPEPSEWIWNKRKNRNHKRTLLLSIYCVGTITHSCTHPRTHARRPNACNAIYVIRQPPQPIHTSTHPTRELTNYSTNQLARYVYQWSRRRYYCTHNVCILNQLPYTQLVEN